MNKTELINAVAEKAEVTKGVAQKTVNAMLNVIIDSLVDGEDVQINGFGKFGVKEIDERVGHNPQTGEPLTIPAHKKVNFKVGSGLKNTVNEI